MFLFPKFDAHLVDHSDHKNMLLNVVPFYYLLAIFRKFHVVLKTNCQAIELESIVCFTHRVRRRFPNIFRVIWCIWQ